MRIVQAKLKIYSRKIFEAIVIAFITGIGLFMHFFLRNRRITKKKAGRNIIIGNLSRNKGLQAIALTTVDQMRRRFPNQKIYVFSNHVSDDGCRENSIYNFSIAYVSLRTKLRLFCPLPNLLKRNTQDKHIKEIIKSADAFVDGSGYALSSQLSVLRSFEYLLNIMIARKYSIPYYILPQSIGPFDYPLKYKILLYPLMKLYLKYPQYIFIREQEGLKHISHFCNNNVDRGYDIVIQNEGYNLDNIYKKGVYFKEIKIAPNSVCVIPNIRIIQRANPAEIYSIYNLLIHRLLNFKKIVYILSYSREDLAICKETKSLFADNKNVILISEDLNAIEIESIIKQFDFIIGCRYHSLVHSYRNRIPCLAIGWATKYFELMRDFQQLDYFFDCRNGLVANEIDNALVKMINNYKREKETIAAKMDTILKEKKAFDIIFGN